MISGAPGETSPPNPAENAQRKPSQKLKKVLVILGFLLVCTLAFTATPLLLVVGAKASYATQFMAFILNNSFIFFSTFYCAGLYLQTLKLFNVWPMQDRHISFLQKDLWSNIKLALHQFDLQLLKWIAKPVIAKYAPKVDTYFRKGTQPPPDTPLWDIFQIKLKALFQENAQQQNIQQPGNASTSWWHNWWNTFKVKFKAFPLNLTRETLGHSKKDIPSAFAHGMAGVLYSYYHCSAAEEPFDASSEEGRKKIADLAATRVATSFLFREYRDQGFFQTLINAIPKECALAKADVLRAQAEAAEALAAAVAAEEASVAHQAPSRVTII